MQVWWTFPPPLKSSAATSLSFSTGSMQGQVYPPPERKTTREGFNFKATKSPLKTLLQRWITLDWMTCGLSALCSRRFLLTYESIVFCYLFVWPMHLQVDRRVFGSGSCFAVVIKFTASYNGSGWGLCPRHSCLHHAISANFMEWRSIISAVCITSSDW